MWHISNRHRASNLSRLDIFPEDTQEIGADHLGIFINVGKEWKTGGCEKFGYLIRTMQICWGTETESR